MRFTLQTNKLLLSCHYAPFYTTIVRLNSGALESLPRALTNDPRVDDEKKLLLFSPYRLFGVLETKNLHESKVNNVSSTDISSNLIWQKKFNQGNVSNELSY